MLAARREEILLSLACGRFRFAPGVYNEFTRCRQPVLLPPTPRSNHRRAPVRLEWYEGHLRKLRSVLDGEGFIHIMGCAVGQNEKLLAMFAKACAVPGVRWNKP